MSQTTPTLTKEEVTALAARCYRSRVEFARVFLPTWFPTKMPWVHRGIIALRTGRTDFLLDFGEELWPEDILKGTVSHWTPSDLVKIVTNFVVVVTEAKLDSKGRVVEPEVTRPIFELDYDDDTGEIRDVRIISPSLLTAIMMPRGFSKTTLENMLNLSDAVFEDEKFILYVSQTSTHSELQLATIRLQLETNDLLRAVFGNKVPERNDSNKWTDGLLELNNGVRIAALGRGGQIRGISKDAIRPSRIVIDDLQDEEGVRVEGQRQKDSDWFFRSLLPARKMFGTDISKVDFIGTLLHPEAVLPAVMADPDWQAVKFGAIDRQGEALWEYAFSLEKLAKERESYARQGKLDAFDYEYMSHLPRNDGAAFPLDRVTYVIRPDEWFEAVALVGDPAISENPKADFSSFAVVGMGKVGKIHIIDFYAEVGMDVNEQAEKFFELHFAHLANRDPTTVKHGIEAIAYQRALITTITTMQHEKSKTWGPRAYFEVIPILHGKQAKVARVQGILSPRTKAGHVSFQRHFPILETQLKDWPLGKKDGPDAVAMAIQLLDPYASLASNDDEESTDNLPGVGKLPPLTSQFRRQFARAP